MLETILLFIYKQPLSRIIYSILILALFWALLMFVLRKKRILVRILNATLCFAAFGGILYATMFRGEGEHGNPILLPLHSLILAQGQPEIYRTLLMNVLLFVPLGLSLPFVLPERWTCHALLSVIIAASLSVYVELAQFILQLGRTEIDDVLMNTFGAVLGVLAYFPYWVWSKVKRPSYLI